MLEHEASDLLEFDLLDFNADTIDYTRRRLDEGRMKGGRETKIRYHQKSVHQILRDIDYRDWLNQTSNSDKVAERRWENVEELTAWLEKLQNDEHKGESLAQMVNHLSLMDIIERQDEEESGDRVVLMTLHGAKGLEFPHVFLVGMEEELLPHRGSIEEDNIAEERRLAYVGLTRAQQTLVMTCAKRRRRAGELG